RVLTRASGSSAGDFAFWESLIRRDMAALLLEKREYKRAAAMAGKANRAAKDMQAYRIRAAYCRALEAEALLGSGDLPGARSAVDEALAAVPRAITQASFFAPRILYE